MAKKRSKPKVYFKGRNYKTTMDVMKALNLSHKIYHSNYTLEIVSDAVDKDGTPLVQVQFLRDKMNEITFVAGRMIEREIVDRNIAPPELNPYELRYNQFTDVDRLKDVNEIIYCIDIKNAYAQSLLNNGVISNKVFNFLQQLSKTERLAAVGLLAANKNIWCYDGEGNLLEIINSQNENAPFFHLCVSDVDNHMQFIKRQIGPTNYIFHWVDGIYFQHIECRQLIEDYLTEKGFRFTFEKLIKFKLEEVKRRHWISYWQIKPDRCVLKKFPIPKPDITLNKQIIEILGLHSDNNSIIKKIKN